MANNVSAVASAGDFVALPQALLDVYSTDILHEALGVMKYEDFAMRKDELGAEPGETVRFTTYNDITRGGALTENVPMETKNMSASQQTLTVTEYGNAIAVSQKLLRLSWDQVLSEAALLLGRDYAVVRDLDVRDSVVAGGSTLFTTPGAAAVGDVLQDDYFDIETLRIGIERLQTANAPKFLNDFYVCFIHPHQKSYLQRDPDWVDAHRYADTRALFNGEVGRWEDTIFIVTTHQGNGAAAATDPGYEAALDGTGNASQNLYRASLFADQCYGIADALPVEMRDNGIEDFGRKHALAWYAIWGSKVLKSDFLVHIISS